MLNLFKSKHASIPKSVKALDQYSIEPTVQQRLISFLQNPDERSLYHANPRLIADRLQLSEAKTLEVLVAGLKVGIVTLHWEIKCPKCPTIDATPSSLSDLQALHTCPCCHHVHQTNADDEVRITFSIDERLRSLKANANDLAFRTSIDDCYGVVSAHRLMTVQSFRTLFPNETIPPHESLLIRRVAILFTDLADSTALYSTNGDPRAYSLVRQHFDLLFKIVDQHNGVVVKTIGDAVMAAFPLPEDALRSAISMQHQMQLFNQQLQLSAHDQLILKVGLHAGPCISVTLNDQLDYFGTTVNTAARIQSLSRGHDIVITDSLLLEATQIATEVVSNCQQDKVHLKGLSEPILAYYMQPLTVGRSRHDQSRSDFAIAGHET